MLRNGGFFTEGKRNEWGAVDGDVKLTFKMWRFGAVGLSVILSWASLGDVTGKVTLRLLRVPWDAVACAVAAVHHLTITVDGNILLVMRAR